MRENVKIFNEQLRDHINFESFGFQEFENDDFFYSWKLLRKTNDKTDLISYSFSKDKWGDELFLIPIRATIVFEKINRILLNIDKSHLYDFYLLEPTITQFPNFNLEKDKYNYQQRDLLFVKNGIVNGQIFEEALVVFQEHLEKNVLPFFDKIQTLQQINDEILEKYEQREWTKYIIGETMFKSLIIMKLCNNTAKYNEVRQSHKEIITNAIQEGHTQYQERYNTLVELLDYLESGKYLEVI